MQLPWGQTALGGPCILGDLPIYFPIGLIAYTVQSALWFKRELSHAPIIYFSKQLLESIIIPEL